MRFLCAAALSLSVGLWFAFAQDQARVEKLATQKKRFEEENKELSERLQKVKTPDDARAIQAEVRELALLTAGKVLAIAEDDPKDAVGFEAAAFVLQIAGNAGAGGDDVTKAVALLAEYHAANPKMKDLLVSAMRVGPSGDKLLKAVAAGGGDKETKAVAIFLRGYSLARAVEDEEDDKKLADGAKQAIELFEAATKEAPEAKVGSGGTVSKFAAQEIKGLNALLALGVGKAAPEVESLTLDGKKVKLSGSAGKVVLLDVWATWCPPCRAMIPHERQMVKRLEGKPFELISVSVDEKKETLEKFLEKEPMPWTHWWDNGQDTPILKTYRVRGFPTLYLIDHTGVVRHKWSGAPDDKELDRAVDDLVKAAVKAKG
ncbi:redoxin domain-containing protein [Gemmata sp. JC673]|uniref:Redoxin domain-containing protein n=1 Tax=Gemmata algarum TaxID=2975278 RepID=A0ABU5F313_9BACT|nr:redoxin domain-containing protein [Gemmata algarum]MDY3561796.1 redoxin domain-containing protein [Gemmata algarum]